MSSEGILKELHALLTPFHEGDLLASISSWEHRDLKLLKERLEVLPASLFDEQRRSLSALHSLRTQKESLEPYTGYLEANSYECGPIGKELIEAGQIACVILAGGQGSRLGWEGPKALFPIFQSETLLQVHLKNIERVQSLTPVALMCSPLNDEAIRLSLEGMRESGSTTLKSVEVFLQDLLPRMTSGERWFLEGKGILSEGPDGNGKVFHYLARAGILERWKSQGIQHIMVLPIDNPLACFLDPKLIDWHGAQGADVTNACIRREDPYEQVGVLARREGKPCIVEYTEIPHEKRIAKNSDGSLRFPLANTGIFIFRLEFAARLTEKTLPLHATSKPARLFSWVTHAVEDIAAWKFETFLFDALPWASKMEALVYPRHQIYAPLKNAKGEKSPETVRAAITSHRELA